MFSVLLEGRALKQAETDLSPGDLFLTLKLPYHRNPIEAARPCELNHVEGLPLE